MTHILIVGKNFSSMKEYLLANNYEYTVLQDVTATKFPNKKFKNRVVASFNSKSSVLHSLTKIQKPIDGVVCVYENYVLPTSWINEELGLPGMPLQAAEACTDKELMRTLFNNAPEKISPAFSVINSEQELVDFAKKHDFPLILKPANLAKSLLVTKNHSLEELIENYRKAQNLLKTTYAKYAPNRTPKLLVEEFLEGTIHSVDAFVDENGDPHILDNIVDYQTGYDIGYDDNFHYSRILPSTLSIDDKTSLRHVAELGCKSLGIKSSPAHIEIIMTKNGPRIVEIGARNGGYRERMHSYANNIDITANHISVALGKQPTIIGTSNNACAVLELFPKQPGTFLAINNYETLKYMDSLQYISIKASNGQYVGKSSDGYKMCAVIMLGSPSFDTLKRDLEYIRANVTVITDS